MLFAGVESVANHVDAHGRGHGAVCFARLKQLELRTKEKVTIAVQMVDSSHHHGADIAEVLISVASESLQLLGEDFGHLGLFVVHGGGGSGDGGIHSADVTEVVVVEVLVVIVRHCELAALLVH